MSVFLFDAAIRRCCRWRQIGVARYADTLRHAYFTLSAFAIVTPLADYAYSLLFIHYAISPLRYAYVTYFAAAADAATRLSPFFATLPPPMLRGAFAAKRASVATLQHDAYYDAILPLLLMLAAAMPFQPLRHARLT